MPRFRWAWFWEWSERNFVDSRWYAMHIHVTICKCARLSSVVCFQAKGCFQKFFQRGAKPSTPKNDNNFSARWRNNGPGVGVPTAQTKICALFRRFGPNVRVFIASADGVFCILRPVSYLNEPQRSQYPKDTQNGKLIQFYDQWELISKAIGTNEILIALRNQGNNFKQ